MWLREGGGLTGTLHHASFKPGQRPHSLGAFHLGVSRAGVLCLSSAPAHLGFTPLGDRLLVLRKQTQINMVVCSELQVQGTADDSSVREISI